MFSKKIIGWLSRLFILLLALAPPVGADDWRTLVQPPGTLLAVESPATVNARLGGNPPFAANTEVTTIQTDAPLYFVRFYNPDAAVNPSTAIGSWIMRSATVRGLSAAQVRDIFALPAMPSMMTMVQVPTGSKMYTGIAAPIAGWGIGGAQQSKLLGPPWVPAGNFFNQQAIGDCILCYRVLASDGNAHPLATYLDRRIPAAYSDLEKVYTNLDLLYSGPTATQFREALTQLSPLRYGNLAVDALRVNVMVNDITDQRVTRLLQGSSAGRLAAWQDEPRHDNAWIRMAGGSQRGGDLGFNTRSAGIVAGLDRQISAETLLGFSGAYLHSDLDWNGALGGVKTDYAKLGVYAARQTGNWLVQGGINAGRSQGDANRRLAFATLERSATAALDAWEGNARVRIGYRLPGDGITIVPSASLDYFYQHRDAFSEAGADSLNLRVQSLTNRTLRSHVGVNLSWDMPLADATVLTPQFQLGWAHLRPLGAGNITASLAGQPDGFTVVGDTQASNALTAGAGIQLVAGKNLFLFARYDLESRRNLTEHGLSAGVNWRY